MVRTLVRAFSILAVPILLQAQTPDSTRRDSTTTTAPRTSATHITKAHLDSLPIDDPAAAFAQIPGVYLRGSDLGILALGAISLRGGVGNGAATYVDGAPVRLFFTGGAFLRPALNGIQSVDVITGLGGADLSDVQNGVISYLTPVGGDRLQSHWTAHTDNPFGSVASVGYNRFAGDVSGPIPGVRGLTFFASGFVEGQSSEYLGFGAQDVPFFEVAGLDTTVTVNTGSGNQAVAIPKYVQSQGINLPYDWRTGLRFQGNLRWAYGTGSSIAITGFADGLQFREFPGTALGNPALFAGGHEWTRLVVLNWRHRLTESLALEAVMSLGSDEALRGSLDPTSEAATRDPSLGIELSSLQFGAFGGIGVPLDPQIIKDIRTNSGWRVPYLNQTQLRNSQPYRMNPYAMASGGFYTSGIDAPLGLASEHRRTGRWQLDWKLPDGRQSITAGLDADGADLTNYSTGSPITQLALDAWNASPSRFGFFFRDVITFGSATLEAGARYDRVNPGVVLPIVPGFTFSNPNWDQTLTSTSSDAQYQASVSKVFVHTRDQSFATPRIRFGWDIDRQTSVHLAFGQTLMTPSVGAIASNSNTDLTFASPGTPFGRDVTDGVASSFEGGGRRLFGTATSFDLSGYYEFNIPTYLYRFEAFDDPTNPGRQLDVGVLDNLAQGYQWGVDGGVSHRFGQVASGSLSYGLNVSGFKHGLASITTQELATAVHATVPEDWARAGWRSALRNVGAVAQFRMINGIPYTPEVNQGFGDIAPGPVSPGALQAGPFFSERLPWTKVLDLRVTKGVRMNGMDWTIFADFRNLLNFKNLYALYSETNSPTNALFEQRVTSGEFASLANEANSNGALAGTSITLGNCANWQGAAGPVDCVMLRQAEARFGNGDGTYTLAEQTNALHSYFNMAFGSYQFYGPQRTVRVGLALAL